MVTDFYGVTDGMNAGDDVLEQLNPQEQLLPIAGPKVSLIPRPDSR